MKKFRICEDDINDSGCCTHQHKYKSISIPSITEWMLHDDDCWSFQIHMEDAGYATDLANTEYMGYLIFSIQEDYNVKRLCEIINSFFEKYGVAKISVHRQGKSGKGHRDV